ncbi:hypothetical protein EYF80_066837 [Liparis tanakae]|uniref:Uncharacterized protein n=1 Tax=Liparis tanakae TaxID=230148 RepID=A0A4Z2E2C3_9TELE|nr:hypothetical protein EYF80_066837 [Liparis tanakae]
MAFFLFFLAELNVDYLKPLHAVRATHVSHVVPTGEQVPASTVLATSVLECPAWGGRCGSSGAIASSSRPPPPSQYPEDTPARCWPSLTACSASSCQLLPCCCSRRPLHKRWRMPPQSQRRSSGVLPALQRPSASSAERVCSVPFYKVRGQSSPACCSDEHPAECSSTQSPV